MRIALDVYGGDFGLKPNLKGALLADKFLEHELLLVGREPEIREELRRLNAQFSSKVHIVHASQIIDMAKEAVEECKNKPNSSLMVCAELVKEGKADAFVSAGNSGAIMVASLLKIKRIPGIIRPAIALPYPTLKGVTILLDGGANMDAKPWHMVQFAVMGSIYSKFLLNISNPSIGIMSIGEEETKGNSLVLETIPLLKNSGLNFYGPVEGKDLPEGLVDVVVSDGFVGNVILKVSEGLAKSILKMLKDEIMKKWTYKIGAFLMKKIFTDIKKKLNPDEFGGAPLLGINGVVIICHGHSNHKAIFNGIRVAGELSKAKLVQHISKDLEKIKDRFEQMKLANSYLSNYEKI